MALTIRGATVQDVPAVARLFRRSFDPELHPYLTHAQDGASRFMSLPFQHPQLFPDHDMIVAVQGSDIVGVGDFRRSSTGGGFLSYLFVAEEARSLGLATTLIKTFLEQASVTALDLDVFTSNGPANALYNKFGFSSGPRTAWVARDLPPATAAEGIVDFAVQDAAHEAYGFSRFTTDGSHFPPADFGHIGESILKCFSAQQFVDDDVLGRMSASLPGTTEAFAIVDDPWDWDGDHRVLLRSERRRLTVP